MAELKQPSHCLMLANKGGFAKAMEEKKYFNENRVGMKNALSSGLREVSYFQALVGILAMAAVIAFASTAPLIRVYREQ